MFFTVITVMNFVMLAIFGIGAFVCFRAKSQSDNLIFKYGLWFFGLFFVSRLISIVQSFAISSELFQEMMARGIPGWLTGINYFRELLIVVAFVVLIIGFYNSFKKEKY